MNEVPPNVHPDDGTPLDTSKHVSDQKITRGLIPRVRYLIRPLHIYLAIYLETGTYLCSESPMRIKMRVQLADGNVRRLE